VGNVHLIAGEPRHLPALLRMLEGDGIKTSGNPDMYIRRFGNFGIDGARELSEKAAMRAVGGSRRYFVITVDAITAEAQNALLKTLEDPPGDAVFIFIHPAPQTLLPTVRSRAQILDLAHIHQGDALVDVLSFLKARPVERLELLKPMFEKGDDDKRDFGAILSFLSALERELGSSQRSHESGLHAVYRARRYIGDRGALVKPLLEQVALLV